MDKPMTQITLQQMVEWLDKDIENCLSPELEMLTAIRSHLLSSQQIRNDALEEAAKLSDKANGDSKFTGFTWLAEAIRALKSPSKISLANE